MEKIADVFVGTVPTREKRVASLVKYAKQHGRPGTVKSLCKVLKISVFSPRENFLVTGKPVRLNGNDYEVPAQWYAENQNYPGGKGPINWQRGYLYCRQGWNGVYHSSSRLSPREVAVTLDNRLSTSYKFRT